MTKNTKVVKQSGSTHTNNHSARMHSNKQAVPSTGSLPSHEYLRTNDNKVVADILSELQHLNSTGMSQKSNLNMVDRSKFLSVIGLSGHTNMS